MAVLVADIRRLGGPWRLIGVISLKAKGRPAAAVAGLVDENTRRLWFLSSTPFCFGFFSPQQEHQKDCRNSEENYDRKCGVERSSLRKAVMVSKSRRDQHCIGSSISFAP